METEEHQLQLSDYDLDEASYQALRSAFNGAASLTWLLVFIGISVGIVILLYPSMPGVVMRLGLLALALLTAFLSMLFVSGLLKMLVTIVFKRMVPAYANVMRYDLHQRRAADKAGKL